MKIGIGIPNAVPGTSGGLLLDWARRAEDRGFSGLATIDRVIYPSYDSLAVLAAAAGATSRIELMTNILAAPVYPPVLLAKSTASIDQLSGGRLTLGLALGARKDDYAAVGQDFHTRGRDFDNALDVLHRAWRGEPVGPGVTDAKAGGRTDADALAVGPTASTNGRVPVLIGGTSDKAIQRVVTWGAGWTAGGGTAEEARPVLERVHAAWRDARRQGEPRLAALTYYSLGEEVGEASRASLRHYYGWLGDYAEVIAEGAVRTETSIRDTVAQFEAVGVTELYFGPTVASLEQVDRLADLVL
jgi:alkanesulfonate monooxygenase SsuD/methylene tetrahydromethanopterin reductase-like flavin-dependent oxidoreductase (luciferase family)